MTDAAAFDWAQAIASADNPFLVAMDRYGRAPIAFVREVLHAEPDKWQMEALRGIARGHTRLAIRSGHGVGKGAYAAASRVVTQLRLMAFVSGAISRARQTGCSGPTGEPTSHHFAPRMRACRPDEAGG